MRNIYTIAITALGLLMLSLSACSPAYYPPKANVPLLRYEKEAKINFDGNLRALNLGGSYALKNHLGLIGSVGIYNIGPQTVDGQLVGGSRGLQADVGPGYYTGFDNKGVFEVYGTYGMSLVNSDDVNGIIHRFAIQPTIGVVNPKTDLALTLRLQQSFVSAKALNALNGSREFYAEPIVTMRLGGPIWRFSSQVGFSAQLDGNTNYDYNPLIMLFGVQYLIQNNM